MAINSEELIGWAQRAVCQLGNANCAMSSERRRSILLKLNPKLAKLSSSKSGPLAQGLLFSQPFLKELTKSVATFSGLDKAQGSLKRAFHPIFSRVGRYRGRSFGRGYSQGAPRGQYQQQHGGYQDSSYNGNSSFYPTRRAKNRFRKGRYGGNQGGHQGTGNSGETDSVYGSNIGGQDTVLSAQLAHDLAGCMDLRNSAGVQDRALQFPQSGFSSTPNVIFPTRSGLISEEIDSLLKKGAIEATDPHPRGFISSIFLVEKKGGDPGKF